MIWVSTSRRTRGGIATFTTLLAGTPLWSGWRVRHVATHVDGSMVRKGAVFALAFVRVAAILIVDPPALVHIHTASRGSFVRKAAIVWLAVAAGVPVILHVHGGGFGRFHDGASRPIRALIRATLTQADAVVALGERWAGQLRVIAPVAHVVAVPNPVVAAGPTPEVPGPVRVVAAGRIGTGKGTFRLLEAWAALGAERGGARLVVVGDGDVEGARAQVAGLGLGASVDVRPWQPAAWVHDLMARSHVLALPSSDEGQPMVVLEAMARGLCVVVSDVGGLPDLVDDGVTGVLVPPHDAAALVEALRSVLTDGARRARIGHAAREKVLAQHDTAVVWRRLDALYREVLSGPGRRGRPQA